MEILFNILFLLSFTGLIIGLIKPSILTSILKERAKRKNIAIFFGGSTIVFFIALGAYAEPQPITSTKTTSPVIQEEIIEPKNNNVIIPSSYSSIVINEVSATNDKKVLISGETDLPNGAVVNVSFDVWGSAGSDLYIGVNGKSTISDGKFSVSFSIPQRDEFKNGPYAASVLFTPRKQSANVLSLVGKNGEKLIGDLVRDSNFGFNVMEIEKKVDIKITIDSPIFQLPSEFPLGSAERTLAEYISSWKNQNWIKMATFTQKTWLNDQSNASGLLEAWYDFKTIKGFEIDEAKSISDTTTDITFIVNYAFGNQISNKQITARIIKEADSYTPSPQGTWGVNPLSALKEDGIK